MKTYEPLAGTHITGACAQAVALAVESDEPVRFKFNDIMLQAIPTDDPKVIVDRWHAIHAEQQEAYRNSPAGRETKRLRDAEVVRKQTELNAAVEALPKILRTDNHLNALVGWIKALIDPSDDVETKWNPNSVADLLEAAGYINNDNVGHEPEWFNTRERAGRYLVGQAINCMRKGMGPHPITLKFADEYFALPN